jgi:hypothetical protein
MKNNRITDLLAESNELNQLLYGDEIKWRNRTFAYKAGWHFETWRERISDAWLVLTGRAHIGDY